MPLYEYRCSDCGEEYEELVAVTREEPPPCRSCRSSRVEKKMSLFGAMNGTCRTGGFT